MQDALLMRVVNGLGDQFHVARRFVRRERPISNQLRQIPSLDVIHREEVLVFVNADLVNGHDVRVLKNGRCRRFAAKALHEFFRGELAGENHFQRDIASETHLPCFIDNAHAAPGNFFDQLIIAEVANG